MAFIAYAECSMKSIMLCHGRGEVPYAPPSVTKKKKYYSADTWTSDMFR